MAKKDYPGLLVNLTTLYKINKWPGYRPFLNVFALLAGLCLGLAAVSTAFATVNPTTFNYGTVTVGQSSAAQTFTYTNSNPYTVQMAVSLSNTVDFTITSDGCSGQILSGASEPGSCSVAVRFNPASATPAAKSATLTFTPTFYCPPVISVRGCNFPEVGPPPESASLSGTAQAPVVVVTTVAPTPAPPTTAPPTKAPAPKDSAIGGVVLLNGQPAPGFTVQLDSQNAKQVTGPDGRYNFTGLSAGFYVVRVVGYNPDQVMPVGQDYSNQTVTGTSVEKNINFQFVSKPAAPAATTAAPPPPTTPAATTAPAGGGSFNPKLLINPAGGPAGTTVQVSGTGWNPQGPNGQPNRVTIVLDTQAAGSVSNQGALSGFSLSAPIATLGTYDVKPDGTLAGTAVLPVNLQPGTFFLVGNDLNQQKANTNFVVQPQAQVQPECPNVASGQGLRVATKAVARNNRDFYLCVQVVAGADGVNLSDTVIITLPQGATASEPRAGLGTVNITGNTVRWGSFSLSARQSTTLILSVSTTDGNLDGTTLFVSGRFNRGQSFQQRIPGLPPLTEINVAAPVITGGQGGGNGAPAPAAIPAAAPATGVGQSNSRDEVTAVAILAGQAAVWAFTLGLGLAVRRKRKA